MKRKLSLYFIFLLIIFQSTVSAISIQDELQTIRMISYDMVIITPERYTSLIQPLQVHKNSRGVATLIKTTEEIYLEFEGRDHAEQIKFFIQSAIEQHDITYVLFIGGISDIPGRYTHIFFDEPFDYPTPEEWVFTSDFYYADIYDHTGSFSNWDSNENDVFAEYHWDGNTDEIDLNPDVYVGRLACTDETQVSICIDKIITYETQKSWGKEWFTNLVLIAGDGIPFDEEAIAESEYLQEHIIDIMDGFIPVRIWATNGKLRDVDNINIAINEGAGFVFFNGHGLHDLWATYLYQSTVMVPPGSYRTSHIDQLTNVDALPVVISDACYHLQYDFYHDCFGWSFVKNPNGGAIAFIGGSDTDLAYAGSRIVEKGIEKLCLKMSMLYQNGTSYLGELWGKGLIDYHPIDGDIVDILTILQNHLFGDPSLQIADGSQPPNKPDPPIGPTEGKTRESYDFTASTNDPETDDVYYLFDWGNDELSEWIGPYSSGETCTISHSWSAKGTFDVRVRAKDVFGMQSEWSDPLTVSMPKSKLTFNILFKDCCEHPLSVLFQQLFACF